MPESITEISELESLHKELSQRRETLQKNKIEIEAELSSRKRELKSLYRQVEELGLNPNNLKEDIRRMKQVLVVKMGNFQADLEAAEELVKPMMREIQGG